MLCAISESKDGKNLWISTCLLTKNSIWKQTNFQTFRADIISIAFCNSFSQTDRGTRGDRAPVLGQALVTRWSTELDKWRLQISALTQMTIFPTWSRIASDFNLFSTVHAASAMGEPDFEKELTPRFKTRPRRLQNWKRELCYTPLRPEPFIHPWIEVGYRALC